MLLLAWPLSPIRNDMQEGDQSPSSIVGQGQQRRFFSLFCFRLCAQLRKSGRKRKERIDVVDRSMRDKKA
jgi:hypothetical protein